MVTRGVAFRRLATSCNIISTAGVAEFTVQLPVHPGQPEIVHPGQPDILV